MAACAANETQQQILYQYTLTSTFRPTFFPSASLIFLKLSTGISPSPFAPLKGALTEVAVTIAVFAAGLHFSIKWNPGWQGQAITRRLVTNKVVPRIDNR